MTAPSPIGRSAAEASGRRARRSAEYREELARLQPYEQIARQVIALRQHHNLSQEALGQRTGTTKSAISRLESGQHAPTVATLDKIASAFGGHLVISIDVPGTRATDRGLTTSPTAETGLKCTPPSPPLGADGVSRPVVGSGPASTKRALGMRKSRLPS